MNDEDFEAIESAWWLEVICFAEVAIVFGVAIAATVAAAWLW